MLKQKHIEVSRKTRAYLSVLAVLSWGGLVACEQPDWSDSKYVATKLASEDIHEVSIALGKVSNMDDNLKKPLVPALTKVYLKKDSNQKKAMTMLVQLRDVAAKDAYLEEVRSNATKYAGAAAEALGEVHAKESIPDLIKLLESTDSNETKQGILLGFKHMPDPQMLPALIKILQRDADNTPMPLMAYSCELVGDIAQANPAVLDKTALETMTRSMFVSNKLGQTLADDCGLAAQKAGKSVVPELIAIFKGERQDVQKLLMAYSVGNAALFPPNRSAGVAVVRLSTAYAKEAAPLFLELLGREVKFPKMLPKTLRAGWISTHAQTLHEAMSGVGALGLAEAKPLLIQVMRGKKDKDWSLFLDKNPLMQIVTRQTAAASLNMLGDRLVAAQILDSALNDRIAKQEEVSIYFEKQGKPMQPQERYSFNVNTMQAYGGLAGVDGLEKFDAAVKKLKVVPLAKVLQKYRPMLEAGKECLSKSDDVAKGKCFDTKLGDKNELVREKAAFELGRLPMAVAAPLIAKHIGHSSLLTREVLTSVAYRHPSKAVLAKLDQVLDTEKSKKGKSQALDRRRLEYLRAWLVHNAKG